MARHAGRRPILAALLILLSFPASVFTQNSASKPKHVESPAAAIHRAKSDAEMEEISKAEQEGRLLEAEKLLTAAVREAESSSPPDQRLGFLLSRLGRVEFQLGRYSDAVTTARRALAVDRTVHGVQLSRILVDFQNVAYYSYRAGDSVAAEQAVDEGVALARKDPGPQDANLLVALRQATAFDEMHQHSAKAQAARAESAEICKAQAKPHTSICSVVLLDFFSRTGDSGSVQKILSEQAAQGPVDYHGHADYGRQLNALGRLAAHYQQEGNYNLAEATYRKAIAVAENHIPNPLVAPGVYYQYGRLLELEGEDEEAEAAYKHAFNTLEHMQGRFRFVAIERLSEAPLVLFYRRQGRLSDAEAVLKRALADQEKALKPNDAALAYTLVRLAEVESREGEYPDAEQLCERALNIQQADYGLDSPQIVQTLGLYASVERQLHKKDKADALAARAAAIRQKLRGRR